MNTEDLLTFILIVEIVHLAIVYSKLSKHLPWTCHHERPCEKYNWWHFS